MAGNFFPTPVGQLSQQCLSWMLSTAVPEDLCDCLYHALCSLIVWLAWHLLHWACVASFFKLQWYEGLLAGSQS